MPVLEADFLKGLIDPSDNLHEAAAKALPNLRQEGWLVASSALLELDLLLKSEGISEEERIEVFEALEANVTNEMFILLTPHICAEAVSLQSQYGARIRDFYFDSLHVAAALSVDGVIVSSDAYFDKIKEVQRIPLQK